MANEIRVTMTGQDDLSSVAASAASKTKAEIDGIAGAASSAGNKMSRDLGGGFDKLGEGAGGAEQKFIGLSDSISGTQDVMQGLQDGNVAQLAMGMADLAGAVEALWSSVGKLIVQYGKKIATWIADTAAQIANTAATVAHTVATYAAAAAAQVWAGAQWLLNAAMSANPIMLVVIAIAALVAAFILAWQHSETFRNIVTGAFDAVKGAVEFVINWVRDNWPLLLAILTGPIGMAVLLITQNWDTIKSGVSGVKDWIVNKFEEIVGFVSGVPGRIWNATTGMFDGIKNAFRSAVNWIIDAWNGLEFGIPGFDPPGPGPTFPGFTLGVPNIPRLYKGGITTGPMVAVIGDNPGGREAVIPLPANGELGGTTIINVYALDGRGAAEAVTKAMRDAKRYGLTSVSV